MNNTMEIIPLTLHSCQKSGENDQGECSLKCRRAVVDVAEVFGARALLHCGFVDAIVRFDLGRPPAEIGLAEL